jgi:hypothetical protein
MELSLADWAACLDAHWALSSQEEPTMGVNMQNNKPVPHEQISSIVLGLWQARALVVVTELGWSDLLAAALHVDELRSRTKTKASALFRLLRALESIGIFAQASARVFGNTTTSECLRKGVPGDFFEFVPTGADAYLLRWILHDRADLEAAAILGTLRPSMKSSARLIVAELVIPQAATFRFAKWTDLQMLVCLRGGERTEAEYRALLTTAGFDLREVVATNSPPSLLVAKPV